MNKRREDLWLRSRNGFSLVEILVVLALIVAVTGLTVPSLMKSFKPRPLGQEIWKLSDLFEFARSTAISKNSYTIVGIHDLRPPDRENAAIAAMVWISKNGRKITKETKPEELIPLSKLLWIENVQLVGSDSGAVEEGVGYFEQSEQGLVVKTREIEEFSRSLQFSPNGMASMDREQKLYRYIQLDLIPVIGDKEIMEQRLLLQLNGITGAVRKVLPEERK